MKQAYLESESALEERCRKYAELQGCRLIKLYQPTGIPDRICLLPNGRHFFVEFKRVGGYLKPIQLHWQKQLIAMGHACFEVDNRVLFERLLNERLILPNI